MLVGRRVSVLAKTNDTYRTATIFLANQRQLRFLDSYSFVHAPLDDISKSLQKEDLTLLAAAYPEEAHQALLREKGLFPYEWVTSYARLKNQTTLPSREEFFSSLTGSTPTEAQYAHAQKVWEGLGCSNLLDYALAYLESDCLILAAFMHKFKKVIYDHFQIEANHMVSGSSLSLSCMFKYTKCSVDRINDPRLHGAFTHAVRGGYSAIHKRYSESNVPGLPRYDASKPERHIQIFDINAVSP